MEELDITLHRPTKWNDRLAFELALLLEGSGETVNEVLERNNFDVMQLAKFKQDKVFLRKVEHYRGEVREKGMTFKLKARAQAEELLSTSWMLIHDPVVSPSVKADLIKSTVKWAGLEPKQEVATEGGAGGVTITINLGGKDLEANVIDGDYKDEEDTHPNGGVDLSFLEDAR